jgi:hypothetical protein
MWWHGQVLMLFQQRKDLLDEFHEILDGMPGPGGRAECLFIHLLTKDEPLHLPLRGRVPLLLQLLVNGEM